MMDNSILFASPKDDTFIIDIPSSIAVGQCTDRKLLSCEPLRQPYPSVEPKSAKARQRVQGHKLSVRHHGAVSECNTLDEQAVLDEGRDAEYTRLIKERLDEVKKAGVESFCGQRVVCEAATRSRKRRKVTAQNGGYGEAVPLSAWGSSGAMKVTNELITPVSEDVTKLLQRLAYEAGSPSSARVDKTSHENGNDTNALSLSPEVPFVHNRQAETGTLSIPGATSPHALPLDFYIPPCSAALNAPIISSPSTLTVLSTFLAQSEPNESSRRFKLILLDPPWPNRSARRSAAYGTFDTTVSSLDDLQDLLSSLPFPDFLAEDGYIAIWITNRPSVRQAVIQLFEAWGVQLVEEWIWVKTTEQGEPVCELDGVWRKPWEVLLVAQRKPIDDGDSVTPSPRRRITFGVPDLHSRKPLFKGLFETLLFGRDCASGDRGSAAMPDLVLELFARYMVTDWFSWGDEALKYQWFGAWAQ